MHLHDIEAWILEESPRFAAAVADYYENNGRNIALFATAHMDVWRGAETYTGTNPHVLRVHQWYRTQIGHAVAKSNFDKRQSGFWPTQKFIEATARSRLCVVARYRLPVSVTRRFKDKVRNDGRFRERVEIQLANAEPLFPSNHFDRILRRIGLYDDLEGKRGRPRKGASARQVALVKEKKLPKKSH